jgi:cysteine synthase
MGPEIWQQTNGTVTNIVAGFGTAMTCYGVGKFVRDAANIHEVSRPKLTAIESDSSLLWLFLELQKANGTEQKALLKRWAEAGIVEIKTNSKGEVVSFSSLRQELGYIPGTGVSGLSSFSQDIFPLNLVDESIQVTPSSAKRGCCELNNIGICAGISSGAVYRGCQQLYSNAIENGEPKVIVGIFMDDHRPYKSLIES